MDTRDPLKSLRNLLDLGAWRTEENTNKFIRHAETITQALSYIEVLKVLDKHADLDQSRRGLFSRYHKLILPRLAAIYTEWSES